MRSIQLSNNEVIMVNGKIYIVQENLLANDKSFSLECIDDLIDTDVKKEIISGESNGRKLDIGSFDLKYKVLSLSKSMDETFTQLKKYCNDERNEINRKLKILSK